jgi:hypothetical protein
MAVKADLPLRLYGSEPKNTEVKEQFAVAPTIGLLYRSRPGFAWGPIISSRFAVYVVFCR